MIMKIHSYLSVNGAMMNAYQDLEQLERTLGAKLATYYDANTLDAWDRAVAHTSIAPSPDEPHAAQGAFREWAAHAIQAGSSATRASFRLPQLATPVPHAPDVATIPGHTTDPRAVRDPHPLAWHPDREVRALAVQIERMRARLYAEAGQGQEPRAMWPYSVSVADFTYFQLVPTLVYQLAYPSTERVRPLYVLERILATFGTFLVIYVITVNWIIPVRLEPDSNLFVVFVRLSVPMILCVRRMADQYLFIFYLIFECVCNGFAELTRFADREFYQDWWNSTSMAEFSRKWNTPVHHFLLQHVYASLISNWGISKQAASLITFLISSVLHELVMITVSGKLRGYLFLAQMSQYPLVLLAQSPMIKNNHTLGNLLFWIGLLIGFPLLNVAYLVY